MSTKANGRITELPDMEFMGAQWVLNYLAVNRQETKSTLAHLPATRAEMKCNYNIISLCCVNGKSLGKYKGCEMCGNRGRPRE